MTSFVRPTLVESHVPVDAGSGVPSTPGRPDVAIVGGGLSGRLLAWRLALSGVRVAIHERGDAHGRDAAAWIAAAMLAPLAEAAVADPFLVALGTASLTRWPEWLMELSSPVFFQRHGTLVLWHAADHAEARLFQRRVMENAPPSLREGRVTTLDAAGVAAAEPSLAGRFTQGWLLADEAQLDNRQLLVALDTALAELQVPIHAGVAIGEENWPDAGVTVDCRGLGAKASVPGLRGIRGEVVRVLAPDVQLHRPIRLLHPRYPIYIAPKENGLYVIGATEVESEDMSPMSVRSALELLSAAFSVHAGFGEARIIELNAHCRPTLPDHRPRICVERGNPSGSSSGSMFGAPGRLASHRISINGLYRHGFMIGPAVIEEATQLVHALLADRFDAWRATSAWPALLSISSDVTNVSNV